MTLDYTHFASQGFADDDVERLLKHAAHFHARGACKGRVQSSFKQNAIDYARVVRAMKQVNYTGWVGVEYVWQDWLNLNDVDTVSATIMMRDLIVQAFNA